jgi:hypothetical protein
MPTVLEEEPIPMASPRLSSAETDPSKRGKVNDSSSNVKCCFPRCLTIRRNDTEKCMGDLRLFFIQKALDKIDGPVKNTSRLRYRSLLVETRTDDQSRILLNH